MIGAISEQAQSMLNDFPSNTGISTTLPERSIIEGIPNLDYNTMSLKLGAYIQLYEKKTHTSQQVGRRNCNQAIQ